MADKILPGKLNKFYDESCLLRQEFIKDTGSPKKVSEVIEELSVKVGEKVELRRFQRFEVGEGVEKQQANLAEEVAAAIG